MDLVHHEKSTFQNNLLFHELSESNVIKILEAC